VADHDPTARVKYVRGTKDVGAPLIDVQRLHHLAFGLDPMTDNERALKVALQDARVLADLYRDGKIDREELEP
jgi:hypothetical protein